MALGSFDVLLHLGDYDYDCSPDKYFDTILSNRSFKFFGVLGNHENEGECGESKHQEFINNIYKEMTNSRNKGTSCTFSPLKTMWSCKYKNIVSNY